MNAVDLAILSALTARARDVVQQIQWLIEWTTDDATDCALALSILETDLAAIIERVQDRESRSWSRSGHRARHSAPRRIRASGLPLSTDVDHGVHVQRVNVQGRPSGENASLPISGRWQHGRLGHPKRAEPEP
jgi:hypothetical protein